MMDMVPSPKNKVFMLKITFFVKKFVIVVSETGYSGPNRVSETGYSSPNLVSEIGYSIQNLSVKQVPSPKLVSQTGYPVHN